MAPVYFDSSVFLAIFAGEASGPAIRALLKELKRDKIKIYTSIITVQEVSVLSFRRGTLVGDNHSKVAKLARIFGITKEIALTAAKLEAQWKDLSELHDRDQKRDDSKRRKWDCFRVATALALQCSTFYAMDTRLLALRTHWGITEMEFSSPQPRRPELEFPEAPGGAAGSQVR